MKLTKKGSNIRPIIGFGYIFIGILIILLLGYENKFFVVFGKLFGLLLVIYGISILIKVFKTTQYEVDINIKNNYLYINDKQFYFGILNIETEKIDSFYRVTFRDNNKIIFKNIVFNEDELKQFLNLAKPYLKSDEIVKNYNVTILIFKKGFSINNWVFFYDEIKNINTQFVRRNNTSIDLDVIIDLKDERVYKSFAKEENQAKMLIIEYNITNTPIICSKFNKYIYKVCQKAKEIYKKEIENIIAKKYTEFIKEN